MLFVSDRSSIQCFAKWKIINPDVLSGKKKITYFSPGAYGFKDNQGREIYFDWQDSCGDLNLEKGLVETEQYSFDYDFINSSLKDSGHEELINPEHRLEFFKDFKEFIETHVTLDIDEEECDQTNNVECVYFEVYDPICMERVMLIGEYDGE